MNCLFPSEIYIKLDQSYMALEIPLRKSNSDQKIISFMESSIWKKLGNNLKTLNSATSFTHNYKKLVLNKPQ